MTRLGCGSARMRAIDYSVALMPTLVPTLMTGPSSSACLRNRLNNSACYLSVRRRDAFPDARDLEGQPKVASETGKAWW